MKATKEMNTREYVRVGSTLVILELDFAGYKVVYNTNTHGSFSCDCMAGFKMNEETKRCEGDLET
jgi:hypothetical protein